MRSDFSSHSFCTSISLDVPAGVTQEEDHTRFFIHLLSAMRALIFYREKDSAIPFSFCICSLWSHLNVFDLFPPLTGGCSKGLGAFWFFFKQHSPKKKKSSILRVGPSSPQLLGFQSSRGSRRNKKAINNQVIIVSLIYPDFVKKTNKKLGRRSEANHRQCDC